MHVVKYSTFYRERKYFERFNVHAMYQSVFRTMIILEQRLANFLLPRVALTIHICIFVYLSRASKKSRTLSETVFL
jgi:hypothetical protein